MTRGRGRPRKKSAAAHATAHPYSWLKPVKSRPPAPFFDPGPALAKVCPETALLCAVLEDALACFYTARDARVVEEARSWFFADAGPTLFSFSSVCEALGLDAPDIRDRLSHGLPVAVDAVLKKEKKTATAFKATGNGAPPRVRR
jgi:hypothetical protein